MARDIRPVEEFLQRLARAARQFHTYPSTSPLCADAITACHNALSAVDGHDRLTFRVAPDAMIVDDARISIPLVASELARRLHAAHVASLDIDRATAPRHLSRLCAHLMHADSRTPLAELLIEDGVDTITAAMSPRAEVLDVGRPADAVRDLVEREQQRRQTWLTDGGSVNYLYPPDKGWVRLDPSTSLEQISLVDLAVLVDDPTEVATMLLRLTGDEPAGAEDRKSALERKFSDVAMLFSSLDPRLARVMFGKLARAVLGLEPERRQNLLQRTILPALLDGRADGTVLRDFPDVDLVDSLFLLLELETAAPEVLTAALHRLDLPAARRDAIGPLLEARLKRAQEDPRRESGVRELDRIAGRFIRIDTTAAGNFSEFAAFDLSIDAGTADAIDAVSETLGATDVRGARLGLLANLVRLQPNPGAADGFLRQAMRLLGDLHRAGAWRELAAWAARYRRLASSLRQSRPEVSTATDAALGAFWTPSRVASLADLHERGHEGKPMVRAVVDGFDVTLVPALLAAIEDPSWQSNAASVLSLMCEYARRLAPALAGHIDGASAARNRAIVKVLGFAGAGYEGAIDARLEHGDEQISREALRALARIGSTEAATLVAARVREGGEASRAAAEEALWRLPPTHAHAQVRQLLGRREFVVEHPDIASRLLTRAANTGAGRNGLQEVLARIEPLRFRFWNPRLVRVALKARELRTR